MATNIRIIHARDFIRVAPEGDFDLEESRKLLMEIASATAGLVDYEIIIDTRKAEIEMSPTDLWYLAAELSKLREAFFRRKTAVLCPLEEFDRAEFFELCAKNRGFQVKAFTSFEDAIEWLTANET
ncbi:MAG: hypothetical protein ABSC04_10080 [Syntrophobacteraceae bacterium]|jgi:hypothetical protein